ncbi:ATP-binding cassette domain-containing protein [Saccharopolyspora elongata]|uniref:ABC transporter ATP-binding protein n=1 Tax=Saccharopolyspora elongata TaxID=2530387 RepID=A0A4R4Y4A8_9PSEU|nr:ATP-binding cassette domain-containing protein [Saccharopolyspora elongata]TDD38966.1 ABC transporter ATP-binding protein [Saccharopolyspora elongata]
MTLLDVRAVTKDFRGTRALRAVDLAVGEGETVGLVGESGSGKSTLLKCVLRLERPDSGEIRYDGIDVIRADRAQRRRFRREVQMVFQDPHASLNPRMTVEQLVSEGMLVHGLERSRAGRRDRVAELLSMVGLDPSDMGRRPGSFSGGQRQRIAIARALAVRPRLLVCDEPVSALDVSVQAQVINLLADMQAELGLAVLFIAHDLAVVGHLCTRIAVISRGEIVESGPREQVFGAPRHEYTRALLDAVPIPDPTIAR